MLDGGLNHGILLADNFYNQVGGAQELILLAALCHLITFYDCYTINNTITAPFHQSSAYLLLFALLRGSTALIRDFDCISIKPSRTYGLVVGLTGSQKERSDFSIS